MRSAVRGLVQQQLKMKTPPDRSGIRFTVGAQLEARDKHKKWYSGKIQRVDEEKEQVLVQFRRWSRRHNEWFHWDSPDIRALDRVSLRRQGRGKTEERPVYVAGSKVMACWTDCRFYPARVLRVSRESYTVRFFDGVVRTVKPTKLKPYDEKWKSENSSEEWDKDSNTGAEQDTADKEGDKEREEEGEKKGEEEKWNKELEEKKDNKERELQKDDEKTNVKEEDQGKQKEEKLENKETSEEMKEGNEKKEVGGKVRKRRADRQREAPSKKKHLNNRNSGMLHQPITAEYSAPSPAHIDRDVLLQRQVHLPTSHKFSREPLYRVIKKQPPPILSIELDHNPFKCPAPDCSKSFRKSSLLHSHLKYYHSQDQDRSQDQGQDRGRDRRKRSSSEGVSDFSETKADVSISSRGDGDTVAATTDLKKTTGSGRNRDRKHFLRLKLKKKKKKKRRRRRSQTGESQCPLVDRSSTDQSEHIYSGEGFCSSEDENMAQPPVSLKLDSHKHVEEGSDWSTLTAESGEDTPPWPIATETEECEVVRCVCEVDEESDFMIQCGLCGTWQHGVCLGLYEDLVPQSYSCFSCRGSALPPDWASGGWRLSSDWLLSGHMFGLSCVEQNYSEENSEQIAHTRRLSAHTHAVAMVTAALTLKLHLLQSWSDPDLRLWRLPWRREEGEGPKVLCYVSSEHCYQKPVLTHSQLSPEEGQSEPDQDQQRLVGTSPELNLLEHIETLQQEVSLRLEQVERELDGLESWLDELESPDPLSRLPELKQRIRHLLRDLSTVRQLSVCG